ncbi:MAG: hypothetical protein ABJ092_04120 [Gillisia sp.]
MKFLLTNIKVNKKVIKSLPYDLNIQEIGSLKILTEDLKGFQNFTFHCSITNGYLRDFNKEISDLQGQQESAINEILNTWPLPDNITGSFSSVIILKDTLEVVLCNDPIGIYPIYYLKSTKGFFVSNSLILMGAISNCKFDEAGIIQRCIGPEFSNFGSRTILENCKRLMPGEYLKFDKDGNKLITKYDNTLYQNISKSTQNARNEISKHFWKAFQRELKYCLNNFEIANIALSGGLDSRIILGAVPKNKKIKCITYGGPENYETKIASRLAKLKKADFQNYYQPDLYFPPVDILKKYTLKTEAVNLCSWLEVLENTEDSGEPILLGDMAEILNGRNITKFSSKKFRQSNFIKHQILKKDYLFENPSQESFEEWKKSISNSHLRWYTEERISQFKFTRSRENLLKDLQSDLNAIFERIDVHQLPYVELYDELFSWYTHARVPMAKQILICNSKFKGYCPSMSLQIVRLASSIHPNIRLSSRLMNKLFKEADGLKELNKIPTNQAPLIPQNYPDIIKFPTWGLRAKIDQYLIKRLVKSKDISKRYRLFKSINWAEIYQNPEMKKNLNDYFKNNHMGEKFFQNLLNQCVQRKELNQWPFANIDIMTAASLNMEIDLIKSLREGEDEV